MAACKVLIVDNDYETCASVSDALANAGFRVDLVGDAQTALERVKSKAYDVLLVESDLPDADGIELFRRVKRLRPNIGAILVTTARSYETLQAAIEAGMWDVLSKPLRADRLVRMIGEVTGESA